MPGVFTIGPRNTPEALKNFARILGLGGGSTADKQANLDTIILGILEGEVRSLAGTMTMEEIFNDRKIFKEKIVNKVQQDLDQFGLQIYNANIKERHKIT